MEKLEHQLTALRDSMRDAEASDSNSFADVFAAFLDLTESTALMDASQPFEDERLQALLENVARAHAKDQAVRIADLQMLHHAPSGLVHGMLFAGAQPGSFFYFLQEQQGIVGFIASMSLTHFYRMTTAELPGAPVVGRKKRRWRN